MSIVIVVFKTPISGDLIVVIVPRDAGNLTEVTEISWAWILEYNGVRHHDSLGGMRPDEINRAR